MEPEKQVIARQVVIVDSQDRPRMVLGCVEDGVPAINIFDKDGNDRLSMYVSQTDTPNIVLLGPKKKPVVFFGLQADGGASIRFRDDLETDRFTVSTDSKGMPTIAMRDDDGNIRLTLAVGTNYDNPALGMYPRGDTKNGISLGLTRTGEPVITASDANGTVKFLMQGTSGPAKEETS